jgi:hypothetical protein
MDSSKEKGIKLLIDVFHFFSKIGGDLIRVFMQYFFRSNLWIEFYSLSRVCLQKLLTLSLTIPLPMSDCSLPPLFSGARLLDGQILGRRQRAAFLLACAPSWLWLSRRSLGVCRPRRLGARGGGPGPGGWRSGGSWGGVVGSGAQRWLGGFSGRCYLVAPFLLPFGAPRSARCCRLFLF